MTLSIAQPPAGPSPTGVWIGRKVRVVVHDARDLHGLFCEWLAGLSPELSVRSEPSAAQLVEIASSGESDLAILDGTAPQPEVLEAIGALRRANPGLAIVLRVGADAAEFETLALRRGAQDCLPIQEWSEAVWARVIRHALERADREHALCAQLRRLTLLLAEIPDYIYFKDESGRYLEVNEALARRFQLAHPDEAIGMFDADFFHPDHAAVTEAEQQEVLRTGVPIIARVVREIMPDGHYRWCLTSQLPFRDARGRIIGTYGISHDITEVRRAEQFVRDSEERYRRLLEAFTDYVYTVLVADGQVVATSHGLGCLGVTGYSPEQFGEDPHLWHRITHPDDRDRVVEAFERLLSDGEPVTIEHRLLRADGSTRWVQNRQVPRLDDCGRIVAYDGLISDITARKEAEELLKRTNTRLASVLADLTHSHEELQRTQMELIEAEKLQTVGHLAAGVAHEVKNPLAILQMGVQFFTENAAAPVDAAEPVLGEMRTAIDRATSVVNDLLHFSASREIVLRDVPIAEVVSHALRLVEPTLAGAGIRVVTALGAAHHLCRVDPHKIEQVLLHVFMNACDAMPAGGTLRVSVYPKVLAPDEVERRAGDRTGRHLRPGDPVVVIEIADTGAGIPAERLSKVFDPFYTTKRTGKGKGLGLSVSKRIIDLHRGELSISSGEGEGVKVTIMLHNGHSGPLS